MSNSKAIHGVLSRINSIIEVFKGSSDEITLPLQAINGADWGYGIHCAKGIWVTECDPSIANEVLKEFEQQVKEQTK